MQRMHSEYGSHKSAPPHGISHALERNKEKDHRESVEQDIRKVMPACL
jgi:hypothetical protein